MSDFRPDLMARAAVTRIENTDPRRIEDIPAAMGEYGKALTKPQLVTIIGYLARWVLVEEAKR